MKVTLSTTLPASEAAARLKEALRVESRGIWVGGADWRVRGSVSGNRFWLHGYIGNPWGLHLYSLQGTFVQTGTGTRVECQFGAAMERLTLPAIGLVGALLVVAAMIAPLLGVPRILVVAVGATLFTALVRFGPGLMWRVWKPELLGFLKDSIDARLLMEETPGQRAS